MPATGTPKKQGRKRSGSSSGQVTALWLGTSWSSSLVGVAPGQDLLVGSDSSARTRESHIGGVAANERWDVHGEGLGEGLIGNGVGQSHRKCGSTVDEVQRHGVSAVEIDAGGGQAYR